MPNGYVTSKAALVGPTSRGYRDEAISVYRPRRCWSTNSNGWRPLVITNLEAPLICRAQAVLDVEFNRPAILLVEEPELHLHPALESSVMQYLRHVSAQTQIFITTHSTNFLDTAAMRNVYLVSRRTTGTVSELVDVADAETRVPTELGIRLSSVFMFDRLVFVEGPTDEAVLRELASIANVNFGSCSVGFIPMGGVRNFTHFAAEATVTFLTKRRVAMSFLLDRDEKNDVEVKRLQDRVRDRATVTVLNQRELENYLVIPRAIAEFVAAKLSTPMVKHAAPDVADVQLAIDEAADGLKPLVVAKRLMQSCRGPFFVELNGDMVPSGSAEAAEHICDKMQQLIGRIGELQSAVRKQSEQEAAQLDANWTRDKIALVPGDQLLDEVCKRFGTRFIKKGGDSNRLAALLTEREIAPELLSFIRSVCVHSGGDTPGHNAHEGAGWYATRR